METCAECGKANTGLKACKACKLVKYCSVDCQRTHWSHHKKPCKKRAAELFEEKLFEQPPVKDECDICCLPMPSGKRAGGTCYRCVAGKRCAWAV
eukprot:scaffold10237_cov71-Cyclotella_meneghiniana.AAC.1